MPDLIPGSFLAFINPYTQSLMYGTLIRRFSTKNLSGKLLNYLTIRLLSQHVVAGGQSIIAVREEQLAAIEDVI